MRALLPLLGQDLVAIRGLALACLVLFALAVATDGTLPLLPEFGFGKPFQTITLIRFGALFGPELLQPWRLLSAVFVHFSALHLIMNLLALNSFGAPIERRFGPARTFLLFVLCGVGGFVASFWWNPFAFTVGASGGIFGLLGATIGVLVARKDPGWKALVRDQLIFALILALLFRVNTAAHVGGFVLGVGLAMLFERERVRPVTSAFLTLAAVLCAIASVASIALSLGTSL